MIGLNLAVLFPFCLPLIAIAIFVVLFYKGGYKSWTISHDLWPFHDS